MQKWVTTGKINNRGGGRSASAASSTSSLPNLRTVATMTPPGSPGGTGTGSPGPGPAGTTGRSTSTASTASSANDPSRGPWLGPVPARRPPRRTGPEADPGDRLHRAVWDGDCRKVERLVREKGERHREREREREHKQKKFLH